MLALIIPCLMMHNSKLSVQSTVQPQSPKSRATLGTFLPATMQNCNLRTGTSQFPGTLHGGAAWLPTDCARPAWRCGSSPGLACRCLGALGLFGPCGESLLASSALAFAFCFAAALTFALPFGCPCAAAAAPFALGGIHYKFTSTGVNTWNPIFHFYFFCITLVFRRVPQKSKSV